VRRLRRVSRNPPSSRTTTTMRMMMSMFGLLSLGWIRSFMAASVYRLALPLKLSTALSTVF
jgi:hypothetical protein